MERSSMLNLFLFIFDPFFPCIATPLTFIISNTFRFLFLLNDLENEKLQMQNTLYNGTDFIPFIIPKFLVEILIAYTGSYFSI